MTAPTTPQVSHLVGPQPRFSTLGDRALLALLLLYLTLGKGFAYFGVPPIFIGEIALGFTLLATVRTTMTLPRGVAPACAALFAIAGTVQLLDDVLFSTIPLIESFRGFALVYYFAFSLVVHASLSHAERRHGFDETADRLDDTVRRYVQWMLPVLLVLALRLVIASIPSPRWPGSGIPVLFTKSTDISVALAFALPFVRDLVRRHAPLARTSALVWVAAALLVTARSRAGVIAIAIAALITFGVRAVYVLRGILLVTIGYATLAVTGFAVTVGQRELSASGLRNSVIAVYDPAAASDGSYVGTTRWRSQWWQAIWSDIEAKGMWLRGNGWGTNLAAKYLAPDSVPDTAFTALRLPHNTFFSIAGRAGVLAAALYLSVPTATFVRARSSRVARRTSPLFLALQSTLVAGVAVGLTDVYIESPQGGILFWSVCGALWWWALPRQSPHAEA